MRLHGVRKTRLKKLRVVQSRKIITMIKETHYWSLNFLVKWAGEHCQPLPLPESITGWRARTNQLQEFTSIATRLSTHTQTHTLGLTWTDRGTMTCKWTGILACPAVLLAMQEYWPAWEVSARSSTKEPPTIHTPPPTSPPPTTSEPRYQLERGINSGSWGVTATTFSLEVVRPEGQEGDAKASVPERAV